LCGWGGSAQGKDASQDAPYLGIGGNPALGVQLAQGDVQCPLLWPYLPQAVQREMDAFADADPGGTDEQQRLGGEIIAAAQFLLQELVLVEGERSGKIAGLGRKVGMTNEIGKKGVTVSGQVVQQAPETNQMMDAGLVAEGRGLLA